VKRVQISAQKRANVAQNGTVNHCVKILNMSSLREDLSGTTPTPPLVACAFIVLDGVSGSKSISCYPGKPCFDPAAGSDTALPFTEQVLVLATIIGSVAALPSFIEFISGVRKRRERIDSRSKTKPSTSFTPASPAWTTCSHRSKIW